MISAVFGRIRRGDPLPGFGLSFGVTVLWVGLLVILPLTALALRPWHDGGGAMLAALTDGRTLASLRTTFFCAAAAALLNIPLGVVIAWSLARTRFPGCRIADALIDLPFAIPTAVTGITLATLYGPHGWLGQIFTLAGLRIAYTKAGIVLALMFVGLPFIIRSVEPVLRNLPGDAEEAATLLGASPSQIVTKIVLPPLLPAVVTGFGLAFARGIGEYGSVIFIAGNRPWVSEIAPLLVVVRLQEFDYAGATSVALILLLTSFLCLGAVAVLRRRLARMTGEENAA
ncbi:sulfate ABC transporter permease subunit CysT [Acetobacter sp. AN02]|uniref:sulfate ABC transporter permease subunit CysT n=1 Tax=Acetobacter sp. AN02 TaxID=2894186 RepID=UPI0024342753|nr:sulfate ABC transporter permease subunit CysT [Acetobacter sp. AN02]MDG6094650.1 sulfate ABC transporter permease subunit CysT [Acetobacter sp. AN02]